MLKKKSTEQLVVPQKYLKNNDVVRILLFSYYPSLIFKSQTTSPSLLHTCLPKPTLCGTPLHS